MSDPLKKICGNLCQVTASDTNFHYFELSDIYLSGEQWLNTFLKKYCKFIW